MIKLSKCFSCFTAIFVWAMLFGSAQAETETVEEVAYSIISDNDYRDVRRSIDVRLDKKVSAEALGTIARKLKNRVFPNRSGPFRP